MFPPVSYPPVILCCHSLFNATFFRWLPPCDVFYLVFCKNSTMKLKFQFLCGFQSPLFWVKLPPDKRMWPSWQLPSTVSISCFRKLKHEMDTVDWPVYNILCRDIGLIMDPADSVIVEDSNSHLHLKRWSMTRTEGPVPTSQARTAKGGHSYSNQYTRIRTVNKYNLELLSLERDQRCLCVARFIFFLRNWED